MRIHPAIWCVLSIAVLIEIARSIWSFGALEYLPYLTGLSALLALVLGWRALFHDPAPGKDMCPRCLYETTAIRGETCPECGLRAASPRVWRSRPRHWKHATLALAIVLAFPASLFARRAVVDGFWPAWPATALVLALPALPHEAWSELENRLIDRPDALSSWQRRALAKRCKATALSQRDLGVRLTAIDLLFWLEPESVDALVAFRGMIHDPDPFVTDWIITRCRSSWLPRELAAFIADPAVEPSRRVDAIWSVGTKRLSTPELTEALQNALSDEDPAVREAAVDVLAAQRESARRQNSGGGLGWNWVIVTDAVLSH